MKRKTLDFIIRQNGGETGFFARVGKKRLIIGTSVILGVVLLGGVYLWYVNNYVNARKVALEPVKQIEYEWISDAADSGIVKDYLWSRTKELMLKNAKDDVLIVEKVTLPGKLLEQTQEESGTYKLYDQALLLKCYVREGDRIKAMALIKEVDGRFDYASESIGAKVAYLDAFLNYYSAFGSKNDEKKINNMVAELFDENGLLKTTKITVRTYEGQAYVYSSDTEAALTTGNATGDLEAGDSDIDEKDIPKTTIEGVFLSNVDLKLIKELENNGYLPQGSYEKNLAIVKGGLISNDIPLYALCYSMNGETAEYVYTSGAVGTINVSESVETSLNLALVNELPSASYSWIKSTLYGTEIFSNSLKLTSGRTEGDESFDSYLKIAQMAIVLDDRDTFDLCARRIGSQIATLDTSPALSMIFRSEGGRNVTYARDNLQMNLLLKE